MGAGPALGVAGGPSLEGCLSASRFTGWNTPASPGLSSGKKTATCSACQAFAARPRLYFVAPRVMCHRVDLNDAKELIRCFRKSQCHVWIMVVTCLSFGSTDVIVGVIISWLEAQGCKDIEVERVRHVVETVASAGYPNISDCDLTWSEIIATQAPAVACMKGEKVTGQREVIRHRHITKRRP